MWWPTVIDPTYKQTVNHGQWHDLQTYGDQQSSTRPTNSEPTVIDLTYKQTEPTPDNFEHWILLWYSYSAAKCKLWRTVKVAAAVIHVRDNTALKQLKCRDQFITDKRLWFIATKTFRSCDITAVNCTWAKVC